MAMPKTKDAVLYYRCAIQRFEEARILQNAEHGTGAVYLAGYGIECMLKALVLHSTPAKRQSEAMQSFRGGQGHDYDWLREQYRSKGGAIFPQNVNQSFTLVNGWSTDLRYTPRNLRGDEADDFLNAVESILGWAKQRF
jgi:hypothetical protein